jgi:prepilin-type N-terminal cleavage/methylation domain-containing protein
MLPLRSMWKFVGDDDHRSEIWDRVMRVAMDTCCNWNRQSPRQHSRRAVSLVEVVVVLAIVGVLSAVSLDAIHAARESARQLHCQNNLRQIGLATVQFEGARGHYPTGGWGWKWVPDHTIRSRFGQPGGWIYQLLPYLEEQTIYDLALPVGEQKFAESKIHELLATPCVVFHCPTRGNRKVVPFNVLRIPKFANLASPPSIVALTDYAANAGTKVILFEGPNTATDLKIDDVRWPVLSQGNGMMLYHHRIRAAEVTAGLSNVIWAGEKKVSYDDYEVDRIGGNDQSMYSGDSYDTRRYAMDGISPDWLKLAGFMTDKTDGDIDPLAYESQSRLMFGAAHKMSANFAMADGSTRRLDINIDGSEFKQMTIRHRSME